MAEANPGRSHGIGIDIVEQIVNGELLHFEVQLAGELLANQLRVLGEEEDSFPRG
jgi:hypothetical protein